MSRLRYHALQRVGAIFIIALTLVPLALSGHHHTTAEGPESCCAICVAAHHAPAASLVLLPRIAPILHSFTFVATPVGAPVHVFRPFTAGRAPPLSLFA
jgi:hypothetical protein